MINSPTLLAISSWLKEKNPKGCFSKGFSIKNVDPKSWSGHFNYLIHAGKRKFVLRFKGPEWGKQSRGIIDEFNILKKIESYKVGPAVFYLNTNFFGEAMMLEEYLPGLLFSELSIQAQSKLLPKIAKFIAKINLLPFKKSDFPFRPPYVNYSGSKKSWQERLKIILKYPGTNKWGKKIRKILPAAEKLLEGFEARLQRVLKKYGPVFIFESSHAGHLMKLSSNLRFLNWEQVSYGDPGYTLAVFLVSIEDRNDFEDIKRKMIENYLKIKPINEFADLVDQRMKERAISNLIWSLWNYARQELQDPIERITSVSERFKKVERFLL